MTKKRIVLFALIPSIVLTIGAGLWYATVFTKRIPTECTRDIGARIGGIWGDDAQLAPACFNSTLTADAATASAGYKLRNESHWDILAMGLPVRTTVAVFTGKPQGPRPFVHELRVRVVVVEDVPISPSMGPRGITRQTLVFDSETGEFLYGTLTGAPE